MKYTLCFIRQENEILFLHRKNPPNANRWNGVGGKLESGELADEACIREIGEETGLEAHSVRYRGVMTFEDGSVVYLFTTEDVSGEIQPCNEGELAWKPISWLYEAPDITVTLPYIMESVLGTEYSMHHAFTFAPSGSVMTHEMHPLADAFLEENVCANVVPS